MVELAYEAYTDACTFGLDEAGVCLRITAKPGSSADTLAIAGRCLGAQYVASLDASVDGLLTALPKPGTRLLFARTEADGRIVLVRSGLLERFVTRSTSATSAASAARGAEMLDEMVTAEVPSSASTERDDEPVFALIADQTEEVEAPKTRSFQEEETKPFSRRRAPDDVDDASPASEVVASEAAAVTRRSPSTVRAFPPPPARRTPYPLVRLRLRHPDRIA